MKKICGKCGKVVEISEEDKEKYFRSVGAPIGIEGAEQYYFMWHKYIEVCPHCGFSALDCSEKYKEVKINLIHSEISEFLKLYDIKDVFECLEAFNNEIANDRELDAIKLIFQASDLLYSQILKINDYEENESSADDDMTEKIEKNAEALWTIGLDALSKYVDRTVDDIDSELFLGCMYLDGNQTQYQLGKGILGSLKKNNLNKEQISILDYVESMDE